MNKSLIAVTLFQGIKSGGATVSAQGVLKTTGLVVALYSDAEHKLEFRHEKYALKEIIDWLKALDVPSWACFGLWVDDQGDIYLDVVEVLPVWAIQRAVEHAQERGQRATQLLSPCTTLWLTEPENE